MKYLQIRTPSTSNFPMLFLVDGKEEKVLATIHGDEKAKILADLFSDRFGPELRYKKK